MQLEVDTWVRLVNHCDLHPDKKTGRKPPREFIGVYRGKYTVDWLCGEILPGVETTHWTNGCLQPIDMRRRMAMSQFEIGDWVCITHKEGPQKLCIVGRVAGESGRHYIGGIRLQDVIVHHDPDDIDGPYSAHPNEWPTRGDLYFCVERLGPEPAV